MKNILKSFFAGGMLVLFLSLPLPVYASDYRVDYEKSKVAFKGTHAGKDFTGLIEQWDADIKFDRDNPEQSVITLNFNPKSFKTGNDMYDETLPSPDWFDVKNYPDMLFVSKHVAEKTGDLYTMEGDLTIKGHTRPVAFDFTLAQEDENHVTASGQFSVDRLSFDIGKKTDPAAEWVSQTIEVSFTVKASTISE